MHSPWLKIPLEDYEAHMALPSVGQAQMLAHQLETLIARHRPRSVAIVGCAGGNGLDRLESTCVERVVAVDINPNYLAACSNRYANRLPNLELCCADVQSEMLGFEPVDLIYAALIFEYANIAATLAVLMRHLRPGGTLVSVLQLGSAGQQAITPSPYPSLTTLASTFRLVSPADLRASAAAAGLELAGEESINLPTGKQFLLQTFKAGSENGTASQADGSETGCGGGN